MNVNHWIPGVLIGNEPILQTGRRFASRRAAIAAAVKEARHRDPVVAELHGPRMALFVAVRDDGKEWDTVPYGEFIIDRAFDV